MRTPYPFVLHGLCLVPTIAFLCCIHLFIGSEEAVFTYFTEIRAANPGWTKPVEFFSNGSLFLFYPVYLFFLLRGLKDKRPEDIFFAVSYTIAQLLMAALLCRIVKIAVGRPRPMTGGPFVPFSFGWGYQSFPSGHTAEIIGSTMPFIWRYGRVKPFILPLGLGLFIAAVAFSRIYLSMHHPTDIWGGLVFGSVSGYVSWALCNALLTRWHAWLPKRLRVWLDSGAE